MAKADFCFTFYDGDATRDMAHMTRIERGAYMDVLIQQRQRGHLSLEDLKRFLSKDFDSVWPALEWILKMDEDGLYFVEWLETSEIRAGKHSDRQSQNGAKGGRPVKSENPNESQIKPKRKPNAKNKKPLGDGDGDGDGDGKENGKGSGDENPKSLYALMKEIFIQKVADNGSVYYFEAKDGVNLARMRDKLEQLYQARGRGGDSDEQKASGFKLILEHITDKWIIENFSIPVINSKWNEIINQISKNGKRTIKADASSHNDDQRHRVMADLL